MAVDGSDTSLAKTCPMLTHKRLGTDDADILLRYHTSLTLAEWLCRTADRIDPSRVCVEHFVIFSEAHQFRFLQPYASYCNNM